MSLGYRARSGLLAALLLVLPTAVAVAVTSPITPPPVQPPTPPISGGEISLHEHGLTFEGPPSSPRRVVVEAQDGTRVVDYRLDADGRARLDVAGENAVADATFVRLEGDPLGKAFRIVLRDPQGGTHAVAVDRILLAAEIDRSAVEAPVKIDRPLTWPGAPQRSYLLHVRDLNQNQLAAAKLDGASPLLLHGPHRAVLQFPLAEKEWDRSFLEVRRAGQTQTINVTFFPRHTTENASILDADYSLAPLAPQNGDTIEAVVIHERRLSPLLVERFPEPFTARYKLDGDAPRVTLNTPPSSIDFRFTVTWTGRDDTSGIGAFTLHYRDVAAGSKWVPWITTAATSEVFSGEWGRSYEIRAVALDRVGNPSAEVFATTTIIAKPTGEDDVNDPPVVRLLSPPAGSTLAGVVPLRWEASDPDGTPITSRVEVSDNEGYTWRLLYAGPALTTTWDTTGEVDGGGYRIRVTTSDGTQSAQDVASALKVHNIVTPPPVPGPATIPPPSSTEPAPPTGQQPAAPPSDEPVDPAAAPADEGGRDVPAPFVGIALLAAALLARRRRA